MTHQGKIPLRQLRLSHRISRSPRPAYLPGVNIVAIDSATTSGEAFAFLIPVEITPVPIVSSE